MRLKGFVLGSVLAVGWARHGAGKPDVQVRLFPNSGDQPFLVTMANGAKK